MGELALKNIQKSIWQNEKLAPWLSGISQFTFFLGLVIELTIVILDKSVYTIQYEGQWFRLTFLLFGISLITTRHSLREWTGLFVFGVFALISYRATGRNELLRAIVFIWAWVGKEGKKAFKLTFWYTLAGCAILVLLSILGIAGEVAQTAIYRHDILEHRYCFGMGHPNAFHCMMLALTLLGVYCYHEKMKWWGYGSLLVFHVLIFMLTKSRASFLVSLGAVFLILLLRYCTALQKNRLSYLLGIACIIGAVAFSVFMARYGMENEFLRILNHFLSGRIASLNYDTLNSEGMLHTWSLWSQERNNYFFDLGIIRFFYWFGILPGAVYFLAQCRLIWCGFKKKDYMLLAIIVAITIYTVFEAHFVSDYIGRNYILFFMGMYLKEMLGDDKTKPAYVV